MAQRSVAHETFIIERTYRAPPEGVFAAWADPEARKRWGPPSDGIAMEFDRTDFRVGGCDIGRCGPVDARQYRVVARYGDIVRNRRIVFTETVEDTERRLSSALVTVELHPDSTNTRQRLTVQIAAIDDAEVIGGNKTGWSAALDNLAIYLGEAGEA